MAAIIITIILSAIAGTMWALCAANKEFEKEEEDENHGRGMEGHRRI